MKIPDDHLELASFPTEAEALRLAGRLRAVGIEPQVVVDAAAVFPGVQAMSLTRLFVRAAELGRAREVLATSTEEAATAGEAGLSGELLCPGCGERNPASFDECWHCQQSLAGAALAPATPPAEAAETQRTLGGAGAPAFTSVLDRKTLLIELAAVLLLAWLPTVVFGIQLRLEPDVISAWDVVVTVLYDIGLVALLAYLLSRDVDWSENLGLAKLRWGREIVFGAATVLFLVPMHRMAWLIFDFALSAPDDPPPLELYADLMKSPMMLTLWFAAGAVAEEVFYRGYLISRLVVLTGSRVRAVVLSSALFALMHGYPLAGTATVFVFGLILGTFYATHQRLPRLILAHFACNMLITLPFL